MDAKITALRIQTRNNYSCTSEQDMTERGSRCSSPTQADVAYLLDWARGEAIYRRGCSGIGAGACVMATYEADGEMWEDRLDATAEDDHGYEAEYGEPLNRYSPAPEVAALPVGSLARMCRLASNLRSRKWWDGNNHVRIQTPHCRALWLERKKLAPSAV